MLFLDLPEADTLLSHDLLMSVAVKMRFPSEMANPGRWLSGAPRPQGG